jgi:hypothetical protein
MVKLAQSAESRKVDEVDAMPSREHRHRPRPATARSSEPMHHHYRFALSGDAVRYLIAADTHTTLGQRAGPTSDHAE